MIAEESSGNHSIIEDEMSSDIDFKGLVLRYISYWKWIALSIAVALGVALVKVKKIKPIYNANASIVIKSDDKGGGGLNEIAALKELGFGAKSSNVDNEIQQFKSRTLMGLVVKDLKLNISYINKRRSYN